MASMSPWQRCSERALRRSETITAMCTNSPDRPMNKAASSAVDGRVPGLSTASSATPPYSAAAATTT